MPGYALLKSVHVASATLSIAGFVLRFALMLAGSPLLGHRVAKVLPHVIDTVLHVSAIAMAVQLGGLPGWLATKIGLLLAYILLGTVALKRGRTPGARAAAGVAAIAVFGYIVSVALTKSPLGLFSG